jgi:hypothetical protein
VRYRVDACRWLRRPPARAALIGLTLALGAGDGVLAAPLPRPTGPVILTVEGAITHTNAPGVAEFDLPLLEQLGLVHLRTWTPWTDGECDFEGVPAQRLMELVGATGSTVRASALNDFESSIPLADFERYPVLLATRVEGKPLEVRDKGPIWIVYPWSEAPELDDLPTRRKSVWQLKSLRVE